MNSRVFRALSAATAAVALVVVAAGAAGAAPASTAKATAKPSLVVTVEGLPKGVGAGVTVTGPRGYKRKLTRSATLTGLRAGSYAVEVKPVHGKGVTWRPAHGVLKVKVSSRARVLADYATGRRDNVHVVGRGAVHAAAPVPGGGGTLTVSTAAAAALHAGGYVVLGSTPDTPDGFIGQVTSVSKAAHGTTKIDTKPATLEDVVPEGTLQVSLPALSSRTQILRPGAEHARGESGSANDSKGVTCESGLKLSLAAQAHLSAGLSFSAAWHFHGLSLPSITSTLTGSVDEGVSLQAKADGAISCDLAETKIGPLISLGRFTFFVDGVPVVVTPKLQFSVSAHAQTQAEVSTSLSQNFHADAGITYDGGKLSPFAHESETHGFEPPDTQANGSLSGTLTGALTMGMYGSDTGAEIDAKGTLGIKADTTKNPWWTLGGTLAGDVGINLSQLKIHVNPTQVLSYPFTIAQAQGPFGVTPTQPPVVTPPLPPTNAPRHVTDYDVDDELKCSAYTSEDEHSEFFEDDACGTFAAVDGQVYGPDDIPAGDDVNDVAIPWTLDSQDLDGSGSQQDPYVETTVADAGDTGVELTETDTWASGSSIIATTYALKNTDVQSHDVIVYHGFDCYAAEDDHGSGRDNGAGSSVACIHDFDDNTYLVEGLSSTSGTSHSVEAFFGDVWSDIASGTDLPDTCRCDETIDNGEALSWSYSLDPGDTGTAASRLSFSDG
jgi:hypothetical protein